MEPEKPPETVTHLVPQTEPEAPSTTSSPNEEVNKNNSGKKTLLKFLVALLIIVGLGAGGYFFVLKDKLNLSQAPTATPSPTPSLTPVETSIESVSKTSDKPAISTPIKNSQVKSPLTVKGTVPAGWMFEGSIPVKLVDENKKLIKQGVGKEVTPGSWTNGKPTEFSATLTFTTTAKSGFLVISADNPSGLPENDKTFELPVKF